MKRAYDMKPYFIFEIEKQIEEWWFTWTIPWIIEAIQCIDMNNWNIENYLFMKYWEAFILEILMSKNDYKKEKSTYKETTDEEIR